MVKLTGREHFVAHQLLIKIYPDQSKLISAAHKMTTKSKHQTGRSRNRLYDWLRKLAAKEQSRRETGKKRSLESIEKRTKTRRERGWNRNPEETKRKQSLASKNKPKSQEHCNSLKISRSRQVMKPCTEEKARKIAMAQSPKRVKCVELDIIFDTARDAMKFIGANNKTGILACVRGAQKIAHGYHWNEA